jgi:hypothetical protein
MEDVLPPVTEHGAGFELTRVRQFTVFLENRVGRLQHMLRAFEESAGRICALSIVESADSALIRIICSEPDLGREALRSGGFSFSESELLVVELPQRAKQPLVAICTALLAAEINIHYVYSMLERPGAPAVALHVEDPTLAARLLIRKGFRIVSEGDLRNLQGPGAEEEPGLN